MTDVAASQSKPFGSFERMLAWRYLFAKRKHGGIALITLISLIGIALAVAAMIIVMSVMNGFRSQILDRLLGISGHALVIAEHMPPHEVEAVLAGVRAREEVRAAAPLIEAQVLATGPGGQSGAMVRGMRAQDLARVSIVHDNVVVGSAAEFAAGSDGTGALVGYRLARALGLDVGDRITLIAPTGATTPFGVAPARQSFEIVGLFQGGVQAFDQAFVFIPLAEAQSFLGRGEKVDRIEVRVADPDAVDATVAALQTLAPGAPVADWRAENQAYFTALQVERTMMRIIFLVLVLITSLNIITGLVMLVKNKGRDIAVLRTMGASRGSVMRVFILVGLMIGLSGVLIGLTIGVLFCMNIGAIQDFIDWATGVQVFNPEIYQLSRLPAEIDPWEVIGVTAWGFLTSLFVTLLPSWNAARLDPVEALRYE